MKRNTPYALMIVLAAALAMPAFTSAAVPDSLVFQGRLTDANKAPRNGSFSMTFRLCDSQAASCASPIWTETQGSVTVTNGVFKAQLGAVTPITPSVFNGDTRYLEIVVNGETLAPRERLFSSAYAYRSATVDDLPSGNTNYIQNRDTLQSGATFYVSSATVMGQLKVAGQIVAGSGNHAITLASGRLDDSKLVGGSTNYLQVRDTLQSGATFYVSSGTVMGQFKVTGQIVAGSGNHAITLTSGRLDDSKLVGGSTNYIQVRETLQSGATFYVSSGTVGNFFYVEGMRVGGTFHRNANTATVSNTTTETPIYAFTLPGGLLESNRTLRMFIAGTMLNNTGNNTRTYRVRVDIGGTTILDKTCAAIASNATAIDLMGIITISNATASSQIGNMQFLGERAGTVIGTIVDTGTSAVNTANDQLIEVTVTNSFASTSLVFTKLNAYAVVD